MHSTDYAVARCLSVRLSHASIVSKQLHMTSKVFSLSGSPSIQVFPYLTGWQYSDVGVGCKGEWKNHDFRPISGFISQMMQDRAIVTMQGE